MYHNHRSVTSVPSTVSHVQYSLKHQHFQLFLQVSGNSLIPSAVHASRLRNVLSELSVMYTIYSVSSVVPLKFLPEKMRMEAPKIFMLLLLAACTFIFTGIRLRSVNPKRFTTLIPVKQLWQPVSAMSDIVTVFDFDRKLDLYPKHS